MNTDRSGPPRLRVTGISSIRKPPPPDLDDSTWRLRYDRYEFAPYIVHHRDHFFAGVGVTPNIGEFSFGVPVGS